MEPFTDGTIPQAAEGESRNAVEADLEEQFADLVFALGGSFVQRRKLPQVGHVNRGAVSDQQLGHLVVAVGAGVVEGHQTAAQRDTPLRHYPARYLDVASVTCAAHPLSLACTSAPWCSRYSTTDTRL